MYADRPNRTGGFNPGSLGVALAINCAVIGALFFAAPNVLPFVPDTPLVTYVPYMPPPPPEPTPPADPLIRQQPRPAPRPDAPVPQVPTPSDTVFTVVPDPLPYTPPIGIEGTGTATVAVDPPKPAPVFVQPGIDPRYAADFQPGYPSEERRAEREGKVVVRVLVGTDGRVKQVERVSATTEAFYRATLDRALATWRFKPATRDGVPVEAWRSMSLTFVLQN
ncbi:energy transducer TonB [Sphingomonas albertensis]|uniref:Energy transducer TonB n=1 Tax=Sphingomonas albertensis TaxID=2762591 RepID=A0ABR7AK12_9SPHN|nr:energy transducer TonB [Sphingomonas albertensis]MBC3940746.1 energy transducer TonB [Sphingomonas albertensis]